MAATEQTIKQVNSLGNSDYKYGFSTELDEIKAPKGLSEEVVRFISAQKNEPDWMLEWRLNAFKVFNKLPKPNWAKLNIPEIDYQDYYYYSSIGSHPLLLWRVVLLLLLLLLSLLLLLFYWH